MSHIVIGTAGHVDHGKTTLIRALTGIDTDRLAEEKTRGLSIDLGFAYFDLPGGRRAGIIDVPGHERFIHNMLAGATSTDVVLLVVAADEGVKPQTRDHVEILDLLGVGSGIVAVSKADLAEEVERQIVRMEIEDLLRGTCLEGAPVVPVSTVTGEGINELREAIARVGETAKGPPSQAPFRLPIDRVFTMTGFGTVVTGTTVAGQVRTHQQVRVLPQDLVLRVRTIQVHEEDVDTAVEGQRTALNLVGASKNDLSRGDTVCDLEIARPSALMDARLRLASRLTKDVPDNARVKLHVGTDEMMARVVPLEGRPLAPGSSQFVQLRLQRPTVAARGDHFVIRNASGRRTLGGGSIIDAYAPRRGMRRGEHAKALESLWQASGTDLVARLVDLEGAILTGDLALRLNTTGAHIQELLSAPETRGRVVVTGRGQQSVCLGAEAFRNGKAHIVKRLEELHARSPGEIGFPPSMVERGWGLRLGKRVFKYCLEELIRTGDVVLERAVVRLPDRGVQLTKDQEQARGTLEALFTKGGMTPPRPDDALREVVSPAGTQAAEQALQAMVKIGELVSVGSGGLLFHRDALQQAVKLVTEYLKEHEKITVAEARDLLGSTRKYLVPLLEYMDKAGHTIRQGDVRVLGRGS
jgi:selenocysteine-specific elongation factor